MNKIFSSLVKAVAAILLVTVMLLLSFSLSPVYRFAAPQAFSGPDIYNPYASLDTALGWKRANFHTHTRVAGPLNECPEYPAIVYDDYAKLGYDILTFSNHNELTRHPYDSALAVMVYEHGYGLFKFHKLVFNPSRVLLFDHLLPLFPSQKQWQYDLLNRDADFLVMNHPDRTLHTTRRSMQVLTGYRFMEADSGISTELRHWDEALSAGHYSYILTNDDCHDSGDHSRIAIRCNWLNTPSARYADVRETLLSGCYYAMRVPDFGNGDWSVKLAENRRLPFLRSAGVSDGVIDIRLSEKAARIEVTGQDRTQLLVAADTCALRYAFRPEDRYARVTAHFGNGVVLYLNPFARYDAASATSPYVETPHPVDLPQTILFNLSLLLLLGLCAWLLARLLGRKCLSAKQADGQGRCGGRRHCAG